MAKTRKSARTGIGGSRELLTWALHGLEQEITTIRQRLQELESQARRLRASARGGAAAAADNAAPSAAAAPKARKKRKLSADARRRIAEAQKRRWAKARAGKE
jgi:uncharacterized membrane protein